MKFKTEFTLPNHPPKIKKDSVFTFYSFSLSRSSGKIFVSDMGKLTGIQSNLCMNVIAQASSKSD